VSDQSDAGGVMAKPGRNGPERPAGGGEGLRHRWNKGRVETFSDGVFAIAITLLVLDINAPSDLRTLNPALEHEWPAYLAYVTSFLTVGGVWVAHHRLFERARSLDSMLMRINLLLLLVTAFLPFPTKILAEALRAPNEPAQTAVILYGATVLTLEVILQVAEHHLTTHGDLTGGADGTAMSSWWGRSSISPTIVLYLVAVLVAIADFPKLAAVLYLMLAIRGILLLEHHRQPERRRAVP
jgi:TMEM175 potassium channel family protein